MGNEVDESARGAVTALLNNNASSISIAGHGAMSEQQAHRRYCQQRATRDLGHAR